MMLHAFIPSTWKTEEGQSLWDLGQPKLQSEALPNITKGKDYTWSLLTKGLCREFHFSYDLNIFLQPLYLLYVQWKYKDIMKWPLVIAINLFSKIKPN